MEELWAEEFMDMVLENVLEDDNEEVVSFLLPIYEDMMQQMGSVTLEETLAQVGYNVVCLHSLMITVLLLSVVVSSS